MAETDARIQDLTPVSSIGALDLLVIEQAGAAMSVSIRLLIQSLANLLDGHGGISDIAYTPPASGSLAGTLTVTLADGTSETFTVTNGRGIASIEIDESGEPGDGAVHTGTITFNDGTTQQFQFRDGIQGDPGQDASVFFAWADVEPSSDADIYFDHTGPFIGICSSLAATAPTDFAAYSWFNWQGPTGEDGATVQSIEKTYTSGLVDTYTITMTDGTTATFTVTNAKSITSVQMTGGSTSSGATAEYTVYFNDGDTFTFYVYNGLNGSGGVSSVSGIQADGNGDVPQVRSGNGPPSTASGAANQLYVDKNNGTVYYCIGNVGGDWSWISAGQTTVDAALSTSSTNPVQNRVISIKIGTAALDTTAQDLSGAVNELNGKIPAPQTSGTPADLGTAARGTATTYARSDHVHKLPSVLAGGTDGISFQTAQITNNGSRTLDFGAAGGCSAVVFVTGAAASRMATVHILCNTAGNISSSVTGSSGITAAQAASGDYKCVISNTSGGTVYLLIGNYRGAAPEIS